MDLSKMLGYKFFRELDDGNIECIRLIKYYKLGNDETIKLINVNTKEDIVCSPRDLKKYKPLQPVGMLMINGVSLEGNQDVIVASYLLDRIEARDTRPFAVCRQNITDVYYNLLIKDESDMIAGLSMNILNIPQGFDYGLMLVSDEILYSDTFMIYKDDTVEELLKFFEEYIEKYDNILSSTYSKVCEEHPDALWSNEYKGWCKSLLTLLKENNYQSDLDEMMGITTVEFEIEPYLKNEKIREDSEEEYITIVEDLKYWLSYLYKLNINKVYVLPYDNDIDFDDLGKSRYFVFRDSAKKLYVFVYTIDGEYKEAELEEKDKQLDFSTKFRINYLNKYRNYKQLNS